MVRREVRATLICIFQVDEYGSGRPPPAQVVYHSRMKRVVGYALANLHTVSSVVGAVHTDLARSLQTAAYSVERDTDIEAGPVRPSNARSLSPLWNVATYQSRTC